MSTFVSILLDEANTDLTQPAIAAIIPAISRDYQRISLLLIYIIYYYTNNQAKCGKYLEMFCGILLVPQNIVRDLNNVI